MGWQGTKQLKTLKKTVIVPYGLIFLFLLGGAVESHWISGL